ncbi:MAG: 1-(5-phosphoribosyl)-5-((5-phosphoribosylamino)methylideneamino)imidazole-4-carboxamide isomerase [Candidatus Eremiobacteraeota bacterium]|nr:1-(5-phosphoribosyl)-5-((5-phosphoribosylamino)methylideneamino)imidazole-4-carboxamide isomerase [Candidatus Eremiobacteraeota bacterium]
MQLIPAIDLRGGKTVRLHQGDPTQERTYDGDPVERAKNFVSQGATQLHVIDLDGAFGSGENQEAIGRICRAVDVPVQSGGGIRTSEQARARLDAGATYIILGTLLVEDERVARNIIATFSGKVFGGIDARGSTVAVRGWMASTPIDRDALVERVSRWGIERIVFTEIKRDGTGSGYDVDALKQVAGIGPLRITASGGARTIDDLLVLKREAPENVDSAVIGSALYENTIDLKDAIKALA